VLAAFCRTKESVLTVANLGTSQLSVAPEPETARKKAEKPTRIIKKRY